MFPNWLTLLVLIMVAAAIKATNFSKDKDRECKFDEVKGEFKCICKNDYKHSFDSNNMFCCKEVGDKCGDNRKCNMQLECKSVAENEMNSETLKCGSGEERCQDKCCSADQICHDGKQCIDQIKQENNCTIPGQCGEIESMTLSTVSTVMSISAEKECNGKPCGDMKSSTSNPESTISSTEEQCNGKPCGEMESTTSNPESTIYSTEEHCNGKPCEEMESTTSNPDSTISSTEEQCNGKSCGEMESTTSNPKSTISSTEEQCNGKPCGEDDTCKEKLCSGICCNSTQICWQNQECRNESICDESKKCFGKCCQSNEICNENNVCVQKDMCAGGKECASKISKKSELKCSRNQQCLDKCCAAYEICGENNVCMGKGYLVVGIGCLLAALGLVLYQVRICLIKSQTYVIS